MDDRFAVIGIRPVPVPVQKKRQWYKDKPIVSIVILAIIVLGCLFGNLFITKDPMYIDLYNTNVAPNSEFWFGTDTMGRDIFSMICYGGRISLFIGLLSTVISTALAILIGAVSGLASQWLDSFIMRLTEIFLSIPNLLMIVLIQAVLGKANVFSISLVIGITGWTTIAKVVRTEIRQIRASEYVIAAKCMGAGFIHLLCKHLVPNIISSIMFMVVMNFRSAIASEAVLSFMGLGLPLEIISWGSMLTLAENALLSGAWWIILLPGLFLVATMVCITAVGNILRKNINQKGSNL